MFLDGYLGGEREGGKREGRGGGGRGRLRRVGVLVLLITLHRVHLQGGVEREGQLLLRVGLREDLLGYLQQLLE